MSIDKNIGENAESQNRDAKAEKRLLDLAVREYVERRFKTDGKAFFEEFSNGTPQSDKFKDFLRKREGYKTLAERKKFSNELFSWDVNRVAFHLDELESAVRNAVALEFTLTNDTNAKNVKPSEEFDRLMAKMKLSELERLAKSPKEREDFIGTVTKENPAKYRNDWNEYLEALKTDFWFGQTEGELLERHLKDVRKFEDVETVKRAFKSGNVSQDEIRTILGFIRTPEAKRAIVKALLPQVSLADLVRMRIFTRDQAEEALYRNLLAKESLPNSLSSAIVKAAKDAEAWRNDSEAEKRIEGKLREIAENFDLDLAFVSTQGLSENGLDRLLERSDIAKILERKVSEGMEELKNILDVEKDLKPDAHGRLSVSFARKIAEEFTGNERPENDIENAKLLIESATGQGRDDIVFEGVVKPDGTPESSTKIRMRITGWTENASTGERKMDVAFLNESGNPEKIDHLTYDEFYRLAHRLENRSFQTYATIQEKVLVEAAEFKRQVEAAKTIGGESGVDERLNSIVGPDIRSLKQLEEMFEELDSAGKSHGIKKGISVTLAKPGEKGFDVATIAEVIEPANGQEGKIVLLNTKSEGSRRQEVTFGRFYAVCKFLGATRSAGISSPSAMLDALGNSLMKSQFEDVSFDRDAMKFVPKSKRWKSKYEGVKVFYKKDGKAFQIGEMEEGRVQIRMLDSFNPGNQGENEAPKGTSSSAFGWYGYETLYTLIRSFEASPYEGIAEEMEIKEPQYESTGRMKKLMDNPSFYDFLHGLQEIPKFVKKKLEHSSHHHAAHATLAIAEKIPWFPPDWLTDLQMEIHNEDKSTLNKEVERLNSFPSPKRHEQALRYLKNKGAHDYEIIAAALSLLEKHGSLYPGALARHEKDWLFFSRMPGTMEEKHAFLKSKRFKEGKEVEVKEPEIIILWLQELSKRKHHPISPYYWLEMKKRWRWWSKSEYEMGGNEADGKETLQERADYAISKFKGKEYAHGIGAMEKIWKKPNGLGSTVSWRMRVPFVLAMSNARNHVHSELAQKFQEMFDDGHTYPPLLFIQHADKQDTFRKVIKRLSREDGTEMAAAYATIDKLMFESEVSVTGTDGKDELLVDALDKFWGKYGDKLSKKLLASVEDPELILRKDEVPEFAEYLSIVWGEYGNTKFDGTEIDCGTYEVGSANWALMAPGTFVKQFKVQAGHGGLNSELEQYLFGTFKQSLEKIRSTKYSDDGEKNKEIKKQLFREFHSNFLQYIHTRLSSDKLAEDPKKKGSPKFANEPYMLQLTSEFGFSARIPEEANFDKGGAYEKWLDADFDRFMAIKSVKQYGNAVSTNVDAIIERNVFSNAQSGGATAGTAPSGAGTPNSSPITPTAEPQLPESSQNPEPEDAPEMTTEDEEETELPPENDEADGEVIRKFDEEHGSTLLRSVRDEIDYVSVSLVSLGIAVDDEVSDGRWIRHRLADFLRAGEAVNMAEASFEIGHLAERMLGKKIADHFESLAQWPERETFLAKIRDERTKSMVSDRLTSVLPLSQDDYESIAKAFDQALRDS